MKDILTVCIEAAKKAGSFLNENFGLTIRRIETKPDSSLATNLDKEAERIIISEIKKEFPSHGIIGEEGGTEGIENDTIWIIDPLDGTHNYIRGINLYGVSIGVAFRGVFTAGAVYIPSTGELYYAEKGNGAYKNGDKINVSTRKNLKDCTIVFDSDLYNETDLKLKNLGKISGNVFNIRMLGSSARQLTYLAEGKIDAIIEFGDKPWDFAGSVSIIEEAGGKITALDGGILTYRHNGFIASNGFVHREIDDLLRELP